MLGTRVPSQLAAFSLKARLACESGAVLGIGLLPAWALCALFQCVHQFQNRAPVREWCSSREFMGFLLGRCSFCSVLRALKILRGYHLSP